MTERKEYTPFSPITFPRVDMETLSLDIMRAEVWVQLDALIKSLPTAIEASKGSSPAGAFVVAEGISSTPSRIGAISDRNFLIAKTLSLRSLTELGIDIEVQYVGSSGTRLQYRESKNESERKKAESSIVGKIKQLFQKDTALPAPGARLFLKGELN